MEFVGTFSLVFLGGWGVFTANEGKEGVLLAAFAHGAVLSLFVTLGAQISGGQYNPAVSIGLFCTGNLHILPMVCFVLAQMGASLCAAGALKFLIPENYQEGNTNLGFPHFSEDTTILNGFILEAIGTFYLMFTIIAAAVHRSWPPYVCGLLIGGTLFLIIMTFGPVTGASLNPARVFGPALVGGEFTTMKGWWCYQIAPFCGSIPSSLFYKFVFQVPEASYKKAAKMQKLEEMDPKTLADNKIE